MRFGQYQPSSAALGRLGDVDCYLMHSTYTCQVLGSVESARNLTHLETPEGGGEELLLEFLGVYQDESKVLLCGAVLGLNVFQTVTSQPLLKEHHV